MARTIVLLTLAAEILLGTLVQAAEPQYFRKNHGVLRAKSLPADLSEQNELWRTSLLPGNSTPCVCGDLLVLTTWDAKNKELATVALNSSTGKQVWRQPAPVNRIEEFHPVGSPASSTPAFNGEHIFVFFGSYGLLCYDLTGKLVWDVAFEPFQDEFGAASSPILVDGMVVLNQDHDINNFLIAIDQQTGKVLWKTERQGFTRSYSTPVLWENGTQQQIIVAGSLQLTGYDAATGKQLWWVKQLSRIVDPTPNVIGNTLYIATQTAGGDVSNRISMGPFPEVLAELDKNKDGAISKSELPPDSPVVPRFFRMDLDQNQALDAKEWDYHASVFARAQNVAMAVRLGGEGDVTESHVTWVQRRSLPTVPSSVVYDDVLYMVKDSGIITSLDAKDGKVLQQGRARGRGNYYASLVAGDDKVYLASERGVITVLKAGQEWTTISSRDFEARILATPVVANGRLVVRTDNAVHCFRTPK